MNGIRTSVVVYNASLRLAIWNPLEFTSLVAPALDLQGKALFEILKNLHDREFVEC